MAKATASGAAPVVGAPVKAATGAQGPVPVLQLGWKVNCSPGLKPLELHSKAVNML